VNWLSIEAKADETRACYGGLSRWLKGRLCAVSAYERAAGCGRNFAEFCSIWSVSLFC
jgi:hypothetical protein